MGRGCPSPSPTHFCDFSRTSVPPLSVHAPLPSSFQDVPVFSEVFRWLLKPIPSVGTVGEPCWEVHVPLKSSPQPTNFQLTHSSDGRVLMPMHAKCGPWMSGDTLRKLLSSSFKSAICLFRCVDICSHSVRTMVGNLP